ncbi:MAG: hypothetical protein SFV15_20380 [Polyangiaceae bacterium]|nr:hypothetical protein [Polyangiaceae bacterium]
MWLSIQLGATWFMAADFTVCRKTPAETAQVQTRVARLDNVSPIKFAMAVA